MIPKLQSKMKIYLNNFNQCQSFQIDLKSSRDSNLQKRYRKNLLKLKKKQKRMSNKQVSKKVPRRTKYNNYLISIFEISIRKLFQ